MPKLISDKQIVFRFKKALNDLADADEDLGQIRRSMSEEDWYRFTSHAAGFLHSSLLNSEPITGINED